MSPILKVYSDLSEEVSYNIPDLPIYVQKEELSRFGYQVANHWHPDLEFVAVESGQMDFFVNGQIISLKAGDVLFVNSKRLHYAFSKSSEECRFISLVVNPSIFYQQTRMFGMFMQRFYSEEADDYLYYPSSEELAKKITRRLEGIEDEMQHLLAGEKNYLFLLSDTVSVCATVATKITRQPLLTENELYERSALREMTSFINENYQRPIFLKQIAAAGKVGLSVCTRLFDRFYRQSPNQYVAQYRLNTSCKLLMDSEKDLREVSELAGFTSQYEFEEFFTERMGQTPQEFRIGKCLV